MNASNMTKYRIGFLMHGARNIGGGEFSIYSLITRLRKDMFEPVVLYANENEIIEKLRREQITLVKIRLNDKITSVYRDEISKNVLSLFPRLFYLLVAVFRIAGHLKRNGIQLLHPHDNLSKMIGGAAAALAGIRVVTHCRDDLKDDFSSRLMRTAYRIFPDRIIAVSERTRKSLCLGARSLTRKTVVIHNGVDPDLFDPDKTVGRLRGVFHINEKSIIISIIGVLDTYKGHTYLFQALRKLKESGVRDFRCLVIGDGRERRNLMEEAVHRGIDEAVLFLGHRNDIPDLLADTDILVIPSIAQEAFPRVALEAMAMQVPVLCTDFGGLPEAVVNRETGLVVPVRDPDAICEGLKHLMERKEVRQEMGEQGRKRVKAMFSIENNARQTEKLFMDVLDIRGRSAVFEPLVQTYGE